VKAWLDRIVVKRLAVNPETGDGPVAGKRVIATTARGGAYGPGMPASASSSRRATCGRCSASSGWTGT